MAIWVAPWLAPWLAPRWATAWWALSGAVGNRRPAVPVVAAWAGMGDSVVALTGSGWRGFVEACGLGTSNTAQTTLPTGAVGNTPKARERPATMVSPRPCRSK